MLVIATFLIIGFVSYKILDGYVEEAFGKKWLTLWGNKVYFWQTIIFLSTAGTAIVIYILKWSEVLAF